MHSYLSEVNISRLPDKTVGVRSDGAKANPVEVPIKDGAGKLLDGAIPKVVIVKDGTYDSDDFDVDLNREIDLLARMEHNLRHAPLAGFIVEGLSPYGIMTSVARHRLMLRAVHRGMPVVRVGRGNNAGFTPRRDRMIGGGNLTATKARLLLMACLMKFGGLPPAADPDHPTEAEAAAIRNKVSAYQACSIRTDAFQQQSAAARRQASLGRLPSDAISDDRIRPLKRKSMPIDVHAHYVPNRLIDTLEEHAREYGVSLIKTPPQCALHFHYGLKIRPFFPKLVEASISGSPEWPRRA